MFPRPGPRNRDEEDFKLLSVETNRADGSAEEEFHEDAAGTKGGGDEDEKLIGSTSEVTILFCTSDFGVLMQDAFPIGKGLALMGTTTHAARPTAKPTATPTATPSLFRPLSAAPLLHGAARRLEQRGRAPAQGQETPVARLRRPRGGMTQPPPPRLPHPVPPR